MRRGAAIPVAITILVALCGAAALMLDLASGAAAARPRQPFANFAFAFLTNSFV